MALRDNSFESSGKQTTSSSSALAGLPAYWECPEVPPKAEWEKWWELFVMAINAKHAISVTELLRTPTQNSPRQAALLNNLNEQAAERKVVSILFLSLGVAGRKNLTDKFPYMTVATAPLTEIKENCEQTFYKPRNRTLERYKFFARKQQSHESLRQFWNILTGLAARCEFGEQTEGLIMDAFIQNMRHKTVQERLCTEPKENPKEALQFAIAYEEGISQQKNFAGGAEIKTEPVMAVEGRTTRNPCTRCGFEFSQNHLAACKAKTEKCRNCGVTGHFARMCKRPRAGNSRGAGRNQNSGNMRRVNMIEQSADQSGGSSEWDEDNIVLHVNGVGVKPFVLKGKINKQQFSTMIDSGSPITIFTKEDLCQILKTDLIFARPLPKNEEYVDYNGRPLNLVGYITVDVEVGKQKMTRARIVISRDGKKSLIGRDWLTKLNYRLTEKQNEGECKNIVNNIVRKEELSPELKQIQKKFPKVFKRTGKIIGHTIKIEFKEGAKITQQKGRRVPLQLQQAVDKEIKNLLEAGHIRKIDKVTDEMFIQPVVITVKKDRSVKIALDARSLNNAILKNKYQMPDLESLMDKIAEVINSKQEGEVFFTSLDMQYAYGQTQLHPETAKHCNFQIVGGETTGTYAFNTGFYGLTTMPPEFQKIMDNNLHELNNTFTFIDDILIVTKGTKDDHLKKVEETIKVLDEAGVRLKIEKCMIAKRETEWLGYILSAEGIKPINEKVQAITEKLRPKNLKDLRSFMGAINQLNKFIPNLANICAPLRPLLKHDNEWKWEKEHEEAFEKIKEAIRKITELKHFKRDLPLRIICDASREGLGAMLQQEQEEGWETTHYASRFLTEFEQKYSINELELLAVVWAVEYFRNFVYGTEFEVVSDHKALTTILRGNRGNKTYSSRLTRWVDRLLPFQFRVVHAPGRTMGMADYLSRHPSESKGNDNKIKAEELWHNWFTVNEITKQSNSVLDTANRIQREEAKQPMSEKLATSSERHAKVKAEKVSEITSANKQTIKQIAATITSAQESNYSANSSDSEQINNKANSSDSDQMSDELIQEANKPPIKTPQCYSVNQIEVLQSLGNFTFASQYESDEFLQKVIGLIKKPDATKINRLPTPWREKFRCLSLDNHDFMYMDERLVIPKLLRPIIMRSLHYGHPGRDSMLATVSNVWWPKLHREVVTIAKNCPQCCNAGKNIKTILRQKQVGKLPSCSENNQEIAIDFAGPFQNAIHARKYLLVSIDHFSGWPEAKFLSKPTTDNVIEFLRNYISRHGIPKIIRTDPATIFRSRKFKEFCNKWLIKHIECPISDHRGNGKIERLIRTINERLRTNKEIVVKRDKSGLSEILFALRMNPSRTGKSPFEKYTGVEPNTIKKLVINRDKFISENPEFPLTETDFESGQDSTILVRERARGSKLEGSFKKRKGVLLEQSNHTITFLPAGSNNPSVLSKRDIGYNNEDQPCCSKEADKRKQTKIVELPTTSEQANRSETSNQSLPPDAEAERTHEPIKRQNEKKAPAMKQFKEKIAKRKQKQKKNKTEKQPTIWEQSENSDTEEETINADEEKNMQNEETTTAHEEKNEQNQPKAEKERERAEPRRGERSRNKTEFYGHNVMITNIDQSPEKQ